MVMARWHQIRGQMYLGWSCPHAVQDSALQCQAPPQFLDPSTLWTTHCDKRILQEASIRAKIMSVSIKHQLLRNCQPMDSGILTTYALKHFFKYSILQFHVGHWSAAVSTKSPPSVHGAVIFSKEFSYQPKLPAASLPSRFHKGALKLIQQVPRGLGHVCA